MIFIYPDYPVDPVKKWKFLYFEHRAGIVRTYLCHCLQLIRNTKALFGGAS